MIPIGDMTRGQRRMARHAAMETIFRCRMVHHAARLRVTMTGVLSTIHPAKVIRVELVLATFHPNIPINASGEWIAAMTCRALTGRTVVHVVRRCDTGADSRQQSWDCHAWPT